MTDYEARVKSVEKIIRSGHVRNDKIEPALEKAGLSKINPDDISELVRKYKYGGTRWARNRVIIAVKRVADKIGGYVSAILVAGVIAEIIAAKQFAGSLIGDKLQGFGDNFLFWIGFKKIEIGVLDMAKAMEAVGRATPKVIKGIVIGAIAGYVLWKIITRVTGYLLKRWKRRKDIGNMLDRYGLIAEEDGSDTIEEETESDSGDEKEPQA